MAAEKMRKHEGGFARMDDAPYAKAPQPEPMPLPGHCPRCGHAIYGGGFPSEGEWPLTCRECEKVVRKSEVVS
jgi:hypothetical protein